MELKNIIMQQHRRSYGPALDIAFSTDKSNVSRTGPNPVHSRASSGTFVNQNGRIVGKTRSTTSLNPARVPVGGVAVFEVPFGSVVGWLNNSVVVVMEDTDGDDQIGAQRHVTGTLIHKTDTAITLLVTSKSGTTTLSSWSVSYRGLRNDHDPVTGLCRGALIEASRTNSITGSNAFNTWTLANSTVAASSVVTPEGMADAWKIVEDSLTASHSITRSFAAVSGTTYAASVWIKSAENGFALVGMTSAAGAFAGATFISVDLSTGAVTTAVGTPVGAASVAYPNGWFRVSFSLTAIGTFSSRIDIRLSRDGVWANRSYLGNGVNGMYCYGAQVEAGRYASSYIPTTAVSSVRAQDLYTITGSNFTNMYNQNKGTVVCSHRITGSSLSNHGVYGITAPARPDAGVYMVMLNPTFAQIQVYSSPPNYTTQASFTSTVVDRTLVKSAIALQTDNFACSINGSIATDNLGELKPIMDRFVIGATGNTSGPQVGLNTFSSLRYYPERLTNAQLQTLTTTTSETITYNGVAITYNGVGLLETS